MFNLQSMYVYMYMCIYIYIHVSSFEFSIQMCNYIASHNPSFISSVQPSNLETVFDNRWSIDILLSLLSGKITNLEVVKFHLIVISPKELFLSSHHWPLRLHLVILYISCYKDIVAEVDDTFHRNRQTWRVLLYYWKIHL